MSSTDENLSRFLDEDGKLTRWPQRRHTQRDQADVLSYLASKFEAGREYTEKEINAVLNAWHTFGDWALLRRELYNRRLLERTADGSRYWVAATESENTPA